MSSNVEAQFKNANRLGAAFTCNQQTSNPIAATESGVWADDDGNLRATILTATAGLAALRGVVPSARVTIGNNPSNTETVVIGGHTFTFVDTLGAAASNTQVKIGADAAAARARLIDAINGTTNANVVQATTPFALAVVADEVGTTVRIRKASSRGGSAVAGTSSSIALSETLGGSGDVWNAANLNVSGKAETDQQMSVFAVTITAAMITKGSFQVELPFTPTVIIPLVYTSAGVLRGNETDAITISSNAVSIALAGGAAPAIQAGDVVRCIAIA